jgi:endonuclease I
MAMVDLLSKDIGHRQHGILFVIVVLLALSFPIRSDAQETSVLINEIHYDNSGQDEGEGIEIAGPAGLDLSGWQLILYNGSNGQVYHEETLSGTIPDQQAGFGTLSFFIPHIQNGSPDGIALVDATGTLVQLLSYEGVFVAADGPAHGIQSTEIGVRETGATQAGQSLQLSGTGHQYADFSWQGDRPQTFGQVNPQQRFADATPENQPIETSCPSQIDIVEGTPTHFQVTAIDPDGMIGVIAVIGQPLPGITLTDTALSTTEGTEARATIAVAEAVTEGTHILTMTFRNNDIPSQTAICTVRIQVGETDQVIAHYYADAHGLSGEALKAALHRIIRDHRALDYGVIWDILEEVDADPNHENHIIGLYTGRSIVKTRRDDGGTDNDSWNREHVWSRSHGLGPRGQRGRFTDAHNLHAADKSVNSSRDDKDFDMGGHPHPEASNNRTDHDSWEARREVRGKIARSMFYMAVRYELEEGDPNDADDDRPDLELVNRTGTSAPHFGKLCVLLEWHETHPPDDLERHRNHHIHEVQGNRNPFIDHPEWVRSIWGSQCP